MTPWLVLSMALLAVAALLGTHLYNVHQDIEALERNRLVHEANIIQRNLALRMQATSNALVGIRDELPELLAQPAAIERRLRATIDAIIGIHTLVVVQRNGDIIASSRPELLGTNIREGEQYKAVVANPDPDLLYVSAPYLTPLGNWAIGLGRMLPDANGSVNGYILAVVDPQYFEELLTSVLYAPDLRAGLTHAQGKVVYRVPDSEGITGMDLSKATGTPFYKHLHSGQQSTVLISTTSASGQHRMVATQTVWPKAVKADYPLIAFASREVSAIFAPWRHELAVTASLYGLFVLVSILGLFAMQRRQLAFAKLQADRECERKAAEENLRKSAQSLQLAIDGGQLGIWERHFATDRYVLSDRCYDFLGLAPRSELTAEKLRSVMHPDDVPRIDAALAEAIEHKRDYKVDYRVIWPDGSVHWLGLHGRISFALDGSPERMNGTAQDITELKEAEARLRRTEEHARLAIEGADVGIWYWDLTTGKVEWSERFKLHVGLPLEQEGRIEHFYEVLHPDDRERVTALVQRSRETLEDYHTEYRVAHPDGTQRWLEAIGRYYLDAQGGVVGMGGVTLDITARKQAEEQITLGKRQVELLNVQLERRAIDAETAKRAKSAFLRAVSHELRTPLNHIMGGMDILLRGQPDAEQENWLRAIKGSANDLYKLVQQLLVAAEDKAGDVALEQVVFSTRKVLEEVQQMQLPRAQAKGLAIMVGDTDDLPERLVGDPARLAQALLNYVDNAIKFTVQGSVTLSAQVLERDSQGVMVRFAVSDTGIGVSPEVRGGLFSAFTQGDSSTARGHGGLGIGLSNTRELAKLMRGEVGVESAAGGGSTFWLTARFGVASAMAGETGIVLTDAASGDELEPVNVRQVPTALPVTDWAAVESALNQLEPMLVTSDLRSQEFLRSAGPLLEAAFGNDALSLWQAATDFDFDAALAVLAEIKAKVPKAG